MATIQIHGHIDTTEAFDALVVSLARFYEHKVDYNDRIHKLDNPKESLAIARNLLLEKNVEDEGLKVDVDYVPDGAVAGLMDCGRRNGIDITVKRTWGSYREDGEVSFVRNGGQPLKLPLASGKVAVNEDTMIVLRSIGMDNVETITRLFGVLRDAEKLPRFTLADDIVAAAVLPRRKAV